MVEFFLIQGGDVGAAPTLQTTNAVLGKADTSISNQLVTTTEEILRQQARDNTPVSKVFLLGFTRPFNKTWQYGGDIRGFSTSATALSPDTSSSIFTGQGIGTGLLSQGDITVLSYSYTQSSDFTANSLSFNNRSPIGDKWTLNTGLLYFVQNSDSGSSTTSLRPTLRAAYKWKEKVTLEMEANFDFTTVDSAMAQTDRRDPFYSLGYRWDF